MNNIRGIYINYRVSDITTVNFKSLEDRGITDIFYASTNQTNITNCLISMETTKLKLHCVIPPFDYSPQFDPENLTAQNQKINTIINIVENNEELKGISFDDFSYPSTYYNFNNDIQQTQTLIDYANKCNDAIKNINPKILFSAATGFNDIRSATISKINSCFDFLIPEIYRINNHSEEPHSWIGTTLNSYLSKSGNTDVVPALITYFTDADHVVRTKEDIMQDILEVLNLSLNSYILFLYSFCPSDLTFPQRKTKYFAPNLFLNQIE